MFFENTLLQQSFDNTSLSIFKDCPRKYYYSIILGWRPNSKAPPLLFGSAYHDCLELFEKRRAEGIGHTDALREAVRKAFVLAEAGFGDDSARSKLTLLRSLVWYSEQYMHDVLSTYVFPNGRVGLEMSFSFPLPFGPEPNQHYYYSGHMDRLAMYSGALYTVERKHTKTTLSEAFFQRYYFSSQIGGYVYAGKVVFDTPVSGAIIDATQVAVNFSRFGRSVVHRVNEHLEEWMSDAHYWIRQVEMAWKEDYWAANTESCGKYAGCQFRKVCSKSPATRKLILETEFRQDRWDPTAVRGDE